MRAAASLREAVARAFGPLCVALPALAAAGAAQAQLALEVDQPAFRVSIPALPAMAFEPHPLQATRPHLRLMGSQDGYVVSVITPTADAGMKPVECASSTLRQLAARAGVPQDLIYKARIDDDTYIVIYPLALGGAVQMNTHLLSAARGTHCIDVHASRMTASAAEARAWFDLWFGARIEPK